jgi:hypothetical protein
MTAAAFALSLAAHAAHAAPSLAYTTHTGPVVFDDNSNMTIDPDPFGVGEGNSAINADDNVELGADGMRHITTGTENVASGIFALESVTRDTRSGQDRGRQRQRAARNRQGSVGISHRSDRRAWR